MPLHLVWHRLHACGHQKLFHKTPSSAANTENKRKRAREVIHQKRQQAVFHLRSRGEEEVVGKTRHSKAFFCRPTLRVSGNQMRHSIESIRSQYLGASKFHLHMLCLFHFFSSLLSKWFWPKYWLSIPSLGSHPPEREAKIYLTWCYTCAICYKTLRVIRMKFLLLMSML